MTKLLICIFGLFALHLHAFMRHSPMNSKCLSTAKELQKRSTHLNMIVVDQPDESKRPVISVGEYFTPPQIDRTNVIVTLVGQAFLTALAFGSGAISSTNVLHEVNFDPESMKFAFTFGVLMLVAGLITDRLPGQFFESTYRDTKFFTLRLLGRNSSPLPAAGTAFLVSCSASISEELFFRGFLCQFLSSMFDPITSIAISSGLFGLAHFPLFGANALVESVLGGMFAFSYIYSGYNIAVPIAIHGLYDFGTIFITWLLASRDLRSRILSAKEFELQSMVNKDPYQVNAVSRMVFAYLDLNADGFLEEKELIQGLQLFGKKFGSLKQRIKSAQDLFQKMDQDRDGRINFEEFSALMTDVDGRPSWFFRAAALSDQLENETW